MEKQVKFVFTCVIALLAIVSSVSGSEYCCPYYTSSGSYRSSFYCFDYCCGTSTSKYCCSSSYDRYYPSYSYSWLCPTATKVSGGDYCCPYYTEDGTYTPAFYCEQYCCGTSFSKYCCETSHWRLMTDSYPFTWNCPAVTANSGEYCCAYYTSSGRFRSYFHCPKFCCGTSISKYCCTSSYNRYYRSYTSLINCPAPLNTWISWSSSTTTSGSINVTGAIVGSVVGFIALCVIIGVAIGCKTGCCGKRRRTVTRPPGNGIATLNTPPTSQDSSVGYAPPPTNTAYGPGIPQPNEAYEPEKQPPYTGPGSHPEQPPDAELGPGIPPPSNAFGPGSPPDGEAAPLDGYDAPPPPYPGTDDTYALLQR